MLFSGTVEQNVALGDNGRPAPTRAQVARAIQIAQGTDFVEALPDAYAGAVAQNGTNFSGGQKQRLSIARAVCRQPEIYIFDDSFSALDYRTDRVLRTELKRQTAQADAAHAGKTRSELTPMKKKKRGLFGRKHSDDDLFENDETFSDEDDDFIS